eukprot:TRINITY_DN202_c0_g1_i1.p1 TRINITY_DN202_c0_g1~~TRINITY_DN202_c0_g1_i1.p1  ORF type:complete len:195 (-),score=40.27 TRINITY_DN202_c0_g1_i1:567-1151(-)
MASFTGTQNKCKICEKTVYLVDQITVDAQIYHKACFRCHHCKSTLKLGNMALFEGVLYCKPHFEQLFKQTGSYEKSFETGTAKVGSVTAKAEGQKAGSSTKVAGMFGGTQDKCHLCTKTVYPLEKVTVENQAYHKSCFKCYHGGCAISPSNYAALEGRLYCKHHYSQLFKEKGNYSQLTSKDSTAGKDPLAGAA